MEFIFLDIISITSSKLAGYYVYELQVIMPCSNNDENRWVSGSFDVGPNLDPIVNWGQNGHLPRSFEKEYLGHWVH